MKKHPKIKVVARDRASDYAAAINEVLPNCIQVADRFHLFDNLIKNLKDIFYEEIPEKIFIKNGQILDTAPKKVAKEIANVDENKIKHFNYDNSIPLDENGNVINFDNKARDFDSKQYKEDAESRLRKKNLIIKVRNDAKGKSPREYNKIAESNEICLRVHAKIKVTTLVI